MLSFLYHNATHEDLIPKPVICNVPNTLYYTLYLFGLTKK